MPVKPKRWDWRRLGYFAATAFIVWIVLGSLFSWLFGERKYRPREGDECGPGHHWVYVGIGDNTDLSCEQDR
jgi:hypothetical protein